MATITKKGYGQVEPNHLSGIVTGQILAQLPAGADLGDVIENGRFAKYDYANGEVNLTGAGEWMLIYNEVKLYDERKQGLKDFAMVKGDYTEGVMVPRLISTVLGDIYTTNAFKADIELVEGDKLYVGEEGWLVKEEVTDVPTFEVAKVYTMPDGQPGVKLMRIK